MQSGFPGKPKTPPTSARAAEKHCSPEIFVGFNLEHVRAGFGSKVNNIMNQLAVAAYANVSVSMAADVGRLLDFVTTWISFFESPLPFCVKKKTSSDRNKMLSRQERVFFQNLSKADPRYAEDFKRAIYKTYYQYKPETTTHIQNTLNRYDLPDRFFGVQIRHGDKAEEADPIQTEDYAHIVREERDSVSSAVAMARSAAQQIIAMESQNIRTVWLASIDRYAEAALRDALGDKYVVKSLNQTESDWGGSAREFYYPGSEIVYDVLTDVEALRRSHTFIGTASSNLARLVYFLREPHTKSVSLDESFSARAS